MISLNKHYANALVNYCGEKGLLEQLSGQAVMILNNNIAPDDVSDELIRFLAAVPSKSRAGVLRRFVEMARRRMGLVETQIITAQSLSDGQLRNITKRFETITGKRLDVTAKVDPLLIGGVQVLAGNILYDESIKTQMEIMNRNMKEALIYNAK